jgi:hypothetical protein
MDKPELVIGYDRDSKPVSAVCSLCQARMPEESKRQTNAFFAAQAAGVSSAMR